MILTVNDLAFRYKSHDILKDIHFDIQQGELTVILGPNGVGKTTLLKCLNKILMPQQGDIFVRGKNVSAMNVKMKASIPGASARMCHYSPFGLLSTFVPCLSA